ncbi:MAG TPA: MFS transporter [Stellaceae bacterium]|jgi:MFS family permease|nr:MFS transporter [Stellaceae bacterium]
MHEEFVQDGAAIAHLPWYRHLNREQWKVLAASNLAWLFDGFEIYALFLTVGFALHQLLDAAQYAQIPRYAGYVLATTVFGWATGGVIGGIIADYLGRKRTMMLAILAYSLTTGLSAIAWNWESFAILRFLVGVGIGSEWATGASIVSELWPDHARGKGGGLLQSGAGIGSFLASGVWLAIGGLGPHAWRFMYLVGVLPALLVLWIWRGMPESARWEEANERRRTARELRRSGAVLEGEHVALTRFTVADMFLDKSVRPRLVGAFLMMLSVTFGFWGVATFVPTYVGMVAAKAGLSAPYYSALAGLLGTGVAIFGFVALGFLSDAIGRKPTTMLYYAMCLVLTPVVYLWAKGMAPLLVAVAVFGFFTGGIWAWAPVWLPELFPTRMRGTAVAFCFNAPRWVSCIGPLVAGTLIVGLGGYGKAATIVGLFFLLGVVVAPFLPETRGKPLPHTV